MVSVCHIFRRLRVFDVYCVCGRWIKLSVSEIHRMCTILLYIYIYIYAYIIIIIIINRIIIIIKAVQGGERVIYTPPVQRPQSNDTNRFAERMTSATPVAWRIRIQPTFALVRVVRSD